MAVFVPPFTDGLKSPPALKYIVSPYEIDKLVSGKSSNRDPGEEGSGHTNTVQPRL
jgi:hypothetical protein